MSPTIEIVGAVAAVLTTASFLPQVHQTWKTKSTESLSLSMLTMFITGVCLWLVYGIALMSWPLIISNVITIASAGLLIYFKLTYPKKSNIHEG